jgi:hypothetical protein
LEENGFGVVETVDSSVGHDTHSLVDGLRGIVKDCVVIWVGGETEASAALLPSIENEIGSVWESGHARDDSL